MEKRFVVDIDGKTVIELDRLADGLWHNKDSGTIWAEEETSPGDDPIVRCGVGMLSLPASWPVTDACRPHDYISRSPAYKAFHTFGEANDYLKDLTRQLPWPWHYFAQPFKYLCNKFGRTVSNSLGKGWKNEQ